MARRLYVRRFTGLTCCALPLAAVALLGCRENSDQIPPTADSHAAKFSAIAASSPATQSVAADCTAHFRAIVRECAPYTPADYRDQKHFRVSLEVVSVAHGQFDGLTPGATVELFIHSPTLTFPPTATDRIGRTFEFCYSDPPAPQYRGDVRVR